MDRNTDGIEELRTRILQNIQDIIDRDGWCLQMVLGTDTEPAYCYTIGLGEFASHPELSIFGLPQEVGAHVIRAAVASISSGTCCYPGAIQSDLASSPLAVVDVEEQSARNKFLLAYHFSRSPHFRQLVWPDERGLYPWSPDFDVRMISAQPVLGKFLEPPFRSR